MGGGSTTAKVASYTLVAADAGTVVQMNSASATIITVNQNLFSAGDTVQIQNIGAGVCTVTAGSASVNTAGSLALSQYEGGQHYFNTASAALFFDIVQSSGMTNPMTTTGDIIYSSSGSTPARLGIGTTGQVVTVASGIPSWATPSSGGKVLQVVYSETSADTSITGTTFTNAGASATITPTLATSKVLVLSTQTVGYNVTNPATLAQGGIRLLRGATVLQATNTDGGFTIMAGTTSPYGVESKNSQVVNYLDSPATTSATTYQIQLAGSGGTTVVRTGFDNGQSSMVLMEIGV
jgi:hypothetical protein